MSVNELTCCLCGHVSPPHRFCGGTIAPLHGQAAGGYSVTVTGFGTIQLIYVRSDGTYDYYSDTGTFSINIFGAISGCTWLMLLQPCGQCTTSPGSTTTYIALERINLGGGVSNAWYTKSSTGFPGQDCLFPVDFRGTTTLSPDTGTSGNVDLVALS